MDSKRKNVIDSLSNKLIYYSLVTVLFNIKYSGSVVILFMFLAAALTLGSFFIQDFESLNNL